ncbi:ABC transporter ATP-binding protein [Shumkonia mesophila]|uniref:ABC transporter ATP-binding protein n=1 Tax=Shumkonia mesophila TaxID=2838854 RepID=UPI00293503D7|nr:ABC transporter ATP-binding protein [Shumkonia mesophila]
MSFLLEIRDLSVVFQTDEGLVHAVDGVSMGVAAGETFCVVGESGCGKSVTFFSVAGLLPSNGHVVGGAALFDGIDLLGLEETHLEKIRGKDIAMIFQDPMVSLNPVHTVGSQIVECLTLHRGMGSGEAWQEARRLFEVVGIPGVEKRLREYPHQLSGGMIQRVMIAMALACRPRIVIADEPTTALDVTIQAQILDLLRQLQREFGMAIILITHDLGVVAEMADRVVVMYNGRVAETAAVGDLFARPLHPYTVGLLDSLPRMDDGDERLRPIEGTIPSPFERLPGCHFAPRCPRADDICCAAVPALRAVRAGHSVACHHPSESGPC